MMLAAACSSSKKAASTATTAGDGGSTATTAGGATTTNCTLSKPIKVVLLAEIVGESAIAVNYYNNGAMIAIDQINKAGGVCGQPIQMTRYPASPLDPQNTNAAYLKALDQNPTAIIGLPGGGTQLAGVLSNVNRGAIPMMIISLGDTNVYYGSKGGSQYAWFMEQDTGSVAAAGTNYYIQDARGQEDRVHGDQRELRQLQSGRLQVGHGGRQPHAFRDPAVLADGHRPDLPGARHEGR